MNFFKSIRSALLWTIGILYMFLFLLFLITVSYLFKQKIWDPWVKAATRLLFKLLWIKVEIKGLENLDKTKTYLFMGNHINMFDIPVFLGFIPMHFRGMEASGHFKTPLYGHALKRYGNIPMERTNPRASFKSIQQGIDLLKQGICVTILPEGTRATKPELGEFKKLPFAMAQKSGVGIMPIALSGLWKINHKTSWHINPGKVTLSFGQEISAETIATISTDELMKITRESIQEMIIEP